MDEMRLCVPKWSGWSGYIRDVTLCTYDVMMCSLVGSLPGEGKGCIITYAPRVISGSFLQ